MAIVMVTGITGSVNAMPSTPAETVYAKSNAPIATEVSKPVVFGKSKTCKNWLVKELKRAGFKGRGLRIAWSIAMRESGGRANAISSTGDYGVFQFNRAAWGRQPWWNTTKLLTRDYNIMIAYRISQEGKTWYPWDISGKGSHLGRYTSYGTYSVFKKWYDKYPCK